MVDKEKSEKKRRRTGWDTPASQLSSEPTEDSATVKAQKIAEQINAVVQNTVLTPPIPSPAISDLSKLQSAFLLAQAQKIPSHSCRIYVGSLHYELPEATLRALFSSFGNITSVELSREPGTTRSKGYAFVEFDNPQSAEAAMAMNGFDLAGRKIKVGRPVGGPNGAPSQQSFINPLLPNLALTSGLGIPGMTNPLALQTAAAFAANPAQLLFSQALSAAALPAVTPTIPTINPALASLSNLINMHQQVQLATYRTVLVRNISNDIVPDMVKAVFQSFGSISACRLLPANFNQAYSVSGDNTLQSAYVQFQDPNAAKEAAKNMKGFPLAGHTLVAEVVPDSTMPDIATIAASITTSTPSSSSTTAAAPALRSIILENMVPVEEATDPDLKDEVAEECSTHGALAPDGVRIAVVDGVVKITVTYVKAEDAKKAFDTLNGRYFGGRKVKASLVP